MRAAFEQGRFEQVEHLARDHLDSFPHDEMALSLLGASLLRLQRPGEAAQVYREATYCHPTIALHWNNLGTALREDGRLSDAEAAYAKALRLEPRNADYLANMGFLHIQWGNVVTAQQYLWQVFVLDPKQWEARIHGAQMCMECGDDANAQEMLEGWQAWSAELGPQLEVELGSLLIRLGNSRDGEMLLRRHENDPAYGSAARARLVVVLERLNRLDEAREVLRKLPTPEATSDDVLRGEILEAVAVVALRDGDLHHARKLMEQRQNEAGLERWRTAALFLLAKICDKQRDRAACMDYLRLAHADQVQLARQLVPDLMAPDATPLRIAEHQVTSEQFGKWPPPAGPAVSESPIFVVGFPRSGTTMLEQMLDAHPDMRSMDERAFVQQIVDEVQMAGLSYPEQLGQVDSGQMERMRQRYWESVSKVVQLQSHQRLVDKNPLNMLRLPMIARMFPESPIIFVMRHPCDVLLSCYMQHFRSPAFAVMCASLESLTKGYVQAMQSWFHHLDLLRPRCMEWRYEEVVGNFDAYVEKLGAFLQLADVAPLRNFSEHARRKGYIGTPSYTQVVLPVYANSVGHWQRYRNEFEPVLPVLEPIMQRCGYDA